MNNNELIFPQIKGATVMTAAQLNAVRLSERRSVLGPGQIKKLATSRQ